jgi:hypothetical protein
MVSSSDRLQTIAFPASHHVISPSLRSFELLAPLHLDSQPCVPLLLVILHATLA